VSVSVLDFPTPKIVVAVEVSEGLGVGFSVIVIPNSNPGIDTTIIYVH
jgi:hypothetical protein